MDAQKTEHLIHDASTADLSREDVQAILHQFATHIGLDGLELDETGSAEIVVDEGVVVTLDHQPGFPGVVASSPMPDDPEHRGDLLRRLLKANMSWALTRGGAFGLLPPDDDLRFCRHLLLADRDMERIDQALSGFVQDVTRWTEDIELYLDTLNHDESSALQDPFVGDAWSPGSAQSGH